MSRTQSPSRIFLISLAASCVCLLLVVPAIAQLRNVGKSPSAAPVDDDGFDFLLQGDGAVARRLGMSEDSIGEVVLTNTYIVGEGGANTNVSCASSYCNTTAILAGGSFSIKLEDRDDTNNYTTADAISFEEVSMGGCSATRANAVGKTATGSSILTKFGSLNSTLAENDQGLPKTEPTELDTPGKVNCHMKTTGSDLHSCHIGCEDDDCGTTSNKDGEGISVRKPGFYNMCVCLNGESGASCSNANKADFDIDLGVLVQVNGFSQASYAVEDICDASIQKCVYGYTCKLSYPVSGFIGGTAAKTDVNTGIGSRYDITDGSGGIDSNDLIGKDAIALMNTTTPCTQFGNVVEVGGNKNLIATAAYKEFVGRYSDGEPYHVATGAKDDATELGMWHGQMDVVEFDFASAGNVDATPGEYRACYCPGAVYGSELSSGLACTAAHPEYFPFKAGKVAIRGPYEGTLGANTCYIGSDCQVILGVDSGVCHRENDTIAIVGAGDSTAAACGTASQTIHGLTSTAQLNGLNLTNPVNATASSSFTWSLPAGSAIQGIYNLCWCHKDHEDCFSSSSTSEDFKVNVGNLTIPGAIASNAKSCYAGRSCTLKFASSDANTDCFGCKAGDQVQLIESKAKNYTGTSDASGLTFYSTDGDAATCGSTNATRTSSSQASAAALAVADGDDSLRYNLTFAKVDVAPALDGSTAVHNLCWSGADDGVFKTLVTLSQPVTVYGPQPDNYVSCSANATDCADVDLGVKRHASLSGGDGEDFIMAQANSEACGSGTTVYFNATEASNQYDITNQKTTTEPTPPGVYKMCYCPTAVMEDTGLGESSVAVDCTSASEYKSEVGTFVVGGPSKALATGVSDSSGVYKVFAGTPFKLEVVGFELGAGHRMKIVNATDLCSTGEFSGKFDHYVSDGVSPSYVSSSAVLASTSVTAVQANGTAAVDIEVASTEGVNAGDYIKFTASSGATQGVNAHTRKKGSLFRTHQTDNAAPRDDWMYKVVMVHNATHFQVEYANFPSSITTLGTHTFQLANKESYPELIASEVDDYKLCWAGIASDYYDAGTVSVMNPTAMPSASLYVATREVSKAGPAIIVFTTGAAASVSHLKVADGTETVKSIYEDVNRSLRLKIRFPDTTMFKPLKAIFGGSSSLVTDTAYDSEVEGAQKYCSKMFFETFSANGFPLPEKCWYQTNAGGTTVDVYMQFSKGNGLKPNTEYQLVMNTMFTSSAANVLDSDAKVEMWILDDPTVHENTAVEFKEALLVSNGYNVTANNEGTGRDLAATAIKFSSDNSSSNMLDLTDSVNKTIKITITSGASRPKAGDHVQIYLYPLTVWDLQPTDISLNALTGVATSSNATVTTDSVIPGGNKNILVIQLADNMTSTHVVEIQATALSLPVDGFFPLVSGYVAQLLSGGTKTSSVDSGSVDFSTSTLFFKVPKIKHANLVTAVDSTNNNAVVKGKTNMLHARVILGSAFTFNGASGDSKITLTLPAQPSGWFYTCTAGTVVTPDTHEVVKYSDEAASVLRKAPTGNGQLAGSFTASGNVCTLKLDSGVVIPAGASLFFKVAVTNPTYPVKASDPLNVWTLAVTQGKGSYSPSVPLQTVKADLTADVMEPRFGKNVAVAGKVDHATSTVSSMISTVAGEQSKVAIYFKTEQRSGPVGQKGGVIEIDAPKGYDFITSSGVALGASSIGRAEPSNRAIALPVVARVSVSKITKTSTTNDRVTIVLSDSDELQEGSYYGLTVPVKNAATAPGTDGTWRLSTYETACIRISYKERSCAIVDTLDTAADVGLLAEPNQLTSEMKLQDNDVPYFDVRIVNNQYNAGTATNAIVKFQLSRALAAEEAVTINLSEGYTFSSTVVETNMTNRMNQTQHAHFFDSNRAAVAWTASSVVASGNQLTFKDAVGDFNQTSSNVAYYLEASVNVPAATPSLAATPSANVFYLSTGKDATANQTAGAVLFPAPFVSKVENVVVEANTAVNGTQNNIRFGFQIVNKVKAPGCVRIRFPTTNLKFTEAPAGCNLNIVPDQFFNVDGLPVMPKCNVVTDNSTGTLFVKSIELESASTTELGSGRYRFGVDVVNPVSIYTVTSDDVFSIETYNNCSAAATAADNIVDKAGTALAFSIREGLKSASLMETSGNLTSTQKPGAVSAYAVGFEFRTGMTLNANIDLVAPPKFVFASNCTADVDFTPGGGPNNVNATMYSTHHALGSNATLVSCTVLDSDKPNVARIVMSDYDNLAVDTPYAFAINVTNPLVNPQPNNWQLTAAKQSKSFEGAQLNFFHDINVETSTPARGDNSSLVIALTPTTTVAGIGASFTVKLPSGFKSPEGSVCSNAAVRDNKGKSYTVAAVAPADDLETARNMTIFGDSEFDCITGEVGGALIVTFIVADASIQLTPTTQLAMVFSVTNPAQKTLGDAPSMELWSCKPTIEGKVCSVSNVEEYISSNYTLDYGVAATYKVVDPLTITPEPLLPSSVYGLAETTLQINTTLAGVERAIGDKLVVKGPTGYDICAASYVARATSSPFLSVPTCTSDNWLVFTTIKNAITNDTSVPADVWINLTTKNPRAPVDQADNFWEVRFIKGAIYDANNVQTTKAKAMNAASGWSVVPLLESVTVEFVAGSFVASATSEISVSFIAVQNADFVVVTSGSGFDVSAATTTAGTVESTGSSNSIKIVTAVNANTVTTIQLSGVKNPSSPYAASTDWVVSTGNDRSSELDTSLTAQGLPIAAAMYVNVVRSNNATQYLGEVAWDFDIAITPSVAVSADDKITIIADEGFAITAVVAADASSPSLVSLELSHQDRLATLTFAAAIGGSATFTVTASTPSAVPVDAAKWMFIIANAKSADTQTLVAGVAGQITSYSELTNTQVGKLLGKITVDTPARTSNAPGAQGVLETAVLELPLDTSVDGAKKMIATASEGYSFPEDCLGEGTMFFTACEGSGNVATFSGFTEALPSTVTVVVKVNHPKAAEPAADWLLQLEDGGVVTQANTFATPALVVMYADVVFQPIASTDNPIAIKITPSVAVEDGTIVLDIPEGYVMKGVDSKLVALGSTAAYDAETKTISGVTVNADEEYVFALVVTPPSTDNVVPMWGVSVHNTDGLAVDAAYYINIPGQQVSSSSDKFLPISFTFSDSAPSATSLVTITIPTTAVLPGANLNVRVMVTEGFVLDEKTCEPTGSSAFSLSADKTFCDGEVVTFEQGAEAADIAADLTQHTLSFTVTNPPTMVGVDAFMVNFGTLDPPVFFAMVFERDDAPVPPVTTTTTTAITTTSSASRFQQSSISLFTLLAVVMVAFYHYSM
eukprot:GHVS01001886.1.p1 GENE.GHVS01001886.1~~GHVS01001886.1.p1  ORF type:complete len:3294 (-),score=516.66 GHVS01001886.1:347-10228(-)